MDKYIDAEKLTAEIERRKKLLENGTEHPEVMKRVEGVLKAYNSILAFVDSLHQEQPIDKNILTWKDVNELERLINKVHYEFRNGIGEEAFGKLVLERFIDGKDDLQELPEVDLEEEVEKFCLEYDARKEVWFDMTPSDKKMLSTPTWSNFASNIARHFYELGLKARKEE